MKFMCLEIINSSSKWYDIHFHYKDALKERDWVKWFLKKWGFDVEISDDGHELVRLENLRKLLTDILSDVIDGRKLSDEQLGSINEYLLPGSMHYEFIAEDIQYKLKLSYEKKNWNYVLCEIAVSFIKLICDYEIDRIGRCENPECRSVFLDESKTRTRRWCCNACASLIKVRKHRAKQHNES